MFDDRRIIPMDRLSCKLCFAELGWSKIYLTFLCSPGVFTFPHLYPAVLKKQTPKDYPWSTTHRAGLLFRLDLVTSCYIPSVSTYVCFLHPITTKISAFLCLSKRSAWISVPHPTLMGSCVKKLPSSQVHCQSILCQGSQCFTPGVRSIWSYSHQQG